MMIWRMGKENDISWAFLYDSATRSLDCRARSGGASIFSTKFTFSFESCRFFFWNSHPPFLLRDLIAMSQYYHS